MLKINLTLCRLILSSLFLIGFCNALAYSDTSHTSTTDKPFFDTFSGNLSTNIKRTKNENKLGLFLFFSTPNCPFCHRMKTTLFKQTNVQTYYPLNFSLLDINIETDKHLIDEQEQRLKQISYAELRRIRLMPTSIFLNQQGQPIYRHVGMIVDRQEFTWLGEYLLS
jgi:thioredoxin-related protein